jgi:hypothetical protein
MPAVGRPVTVSVIDDRLGVSATWLGFEQGGDLARDLIFEHGDSLAHRFSQDLVMSLRSKGFRAEEATEPAQPQAIALEIQIVRFALTVHARGLTKPAWQASWAFVGRAYAEGVPEPTWADFIHTTREERLSTWSLKRYQETIEAYYRQAVSELVDRFSAAVTAEAAR